LDVDGVGAEGVAALTRKIQSVLVFIIVAGLQSDLIRAAARMSTLPAKRSL